jgi:hypothetical protein
MRKPSSTHILVPSLLVLLLISASTLFVTCTKPAPIPAYVHIDSVALHTYPALDGTNSHNISDAWVYVDNQLVGAFELPATIPVPETGYHTLQILGGIKENGTSAERQGYPFYTAWSAQLNLVPGSRTVVNPVVAYTASCHPFDWREDFDGGPGTTLIDTISSDVRLKKDPVNPFEGTYSGSVYLVPSAAYPLPHFQCETATAFNKPDPGIEVYLEVNYRCNNKFYVGLINPLTNANIIYLTFNPTDVWKKMYVRFTDVLNGIPVGGTYKVYFGMDTDPAVPLPEMHIDNIKLIH